MVNKQVTQNLLKTEKKIQTLRTLGIIWFISGISNSVFLIPGFILLFLSSHMSRKVRKERHGLASGGAQ